ncbi:hypothetical protein PT974_11731 [Cladobotryum mycophilum]|uniref:Uncharacterized protein n=1 Tax=Cladobotryum mycophilum TaxID=491253 RepID=A0ABR0S614_9HYPO
MDHTDDGSIPPPISSSKHNRINIWRNEVASASSQCDTASTPSAPSLTTTTTTTSSSSSLTQSAVAALSRGRRFFSRITGRISRRRRRGSISSDQMPDFMMQPPRKDEPVYRTSMYYMLRPEGHISDTNPNDELVNPDEFSSRGDKRRSRLLMETQDRLHRAARLLHHGAI